MTHRIRESVIKKTLKKGKVEGKIKEAEMGQTEKEPVRAGERGMQ